MAGLELIGRPDVFAASFRALLRSYAVDAIDAAVVQDPTASTAEKTQDGVDSPEAFLEAISAEPCRNYVMLLMTYPGESLLSACVDPGVALRWLSAFYRRRALAMLRIFLAACCVGWS